MIRSLRTRVLVLVGGTMIAGAGLAMLMHYRNYVETVRDQAKAEVDALIDVFARSLGEVGLDDRAALQKEVRFLLRAHPKIRALLVFDLGTTAVAASDAAAIGRRTRREEHQQTIKDGVSRTRLVSDALDNTFYRTTAAIVAERRGTVVGGLELVYQLSDYDQLRAFFRAQAIEKFGLLVAVSLLVSAIVAGWVSRPLERLRTALQAVSHGDLWVHIPRGSTREFNEIFDSFNHMASELATLTGALNALNESLQHEIDERTRDAVAQKVRAQVANRAKSDFLANMSHEMRTPLTAILGFTEVILEEARAAGADRTAEAAATVHRNSRHLLDLINEILDLSKVESGNLDVERIPCSPLQILAEVEALMRIRAEASEVALDVRVLGPVPETIRSDPTRLKQVLVNLVGNAIKFTKDGSVVVEAMLVDDPAEPRLQLDVVDSGIGIAPQHFERIFQPFTQADTTTTRRYGGTGLGLAISKRLAQILGGDVELVRSAPGEGSCFRATFATGPIDDVPLVRQGRGPASAPAHAALRPDISGLGLRILVAEDGRDNQRLITLVLSKAGAEVEVVADGQEVIDAVRRAAEAGSAFDVILMDMQMPTKDGYAATRELRMLGCTTPIIALTAHAMAGDREKCLDAGCTEYATKPIRWRQLFASIRALTEPDCAGSLPTR